MFQKIYTICGTLTQCAADQQNWGEGVIYEIDRPPTKYPKYSPKQKMRIKNKRPEVAQSVERRPYRKGENMPSKTKGIGIIGEQILIAEFVKKGITVLTPIGDNSPYDIVIDYNGRFIKVQVKTTEFVKDGKMVFCTNITNPFKKTSRKYTEKEVDVFGLYCIENGYIGLLPICDCSSKETIIRLEQTKNNQTLNVKNAIDYSFDKMIVRL